MGALKEAARKGRGGDTRLGHLTNGDIVFPAEHVDEHTKKLIHTFMKHKGLDPGRFTVGHESNKKNPKTRLPQFEGTGAEGSGEGPGAEGGVGGNGPGGGGTGGPGNGASAGDNSNSGVAGAAVSDPSTSSTTPGVMGTPNASSLTGKESETAVESGTVPGTPEAQASMNDPATAASMGQLGKFGQPDLGVVGNVVGNVVGTPIGNAIRGFETDPIGTLAALGINVGIGAIPGIGQALGLANSVAGLFGSDLGHSVVGGLEGMSGPTSSSASAGTTGTPGAGDLGSLGGGIGTGFDDNLLRKLKAA